jgi:hypothetical protein
MNVRPGLVRCQVLLLQLIILVLCALLLLHQSTLPTKVGFTTICTLVIFLLLTFHESYLHTYKFRFSFGVWNLCHAIKDIRKVYGKLYVDEFRSPQSTLRCPHSEKNTPLGSRCKKVAGFGKSNLRP